MSVGFGVGAETLQPEGAEMSTQIISMLGRVRHCLILKIDSKISSSGRSDLELKYQHRLISVLDKCSTHLLDIGKYILEMVDQS